MAKTEKIKYLIIGNSAGGIGAAETIREVDKEGLITIISDELYPAYSRPLISKYLAERYPLEKMLFRPANFYQENNIEAVLGKKAERLDTEAHTVELDDGSNFIWEKLLLATGGLPIMPPIEGREKRGVFTFTTLDDAKTIDQFLSKSARAVVIGGGLIGVSVSEALVKRGVKSTIVEMKERILNTILDDEASRLEEEKLKQFGVEIITGHTVAKINSDSAQGKTVNGVTLENGDNIACNLVIVAIGVRPRTELASGTGIKINRGIVVDRYMKTSQPDIYACGDVVEAYDFIYDECRLAPIWPNAYLGGRVAGLNMAGVPAEYSGGTAMNSLNYFALDVVSAGIVIPADGSYEMLSKKNDRAYKKVVLKDGRVVGMVFMDDIEKSGIILSLMKERVKVSHFKQELLADDFSLASLPEEIWRPRLEVPASVSPAIPAEKPAEIVVGE